MKTELDPEDKERIEQEAQEKFGQFRKFSEQRAMIMGAEYATIYEREQQAKEWIKSSERMPEFNVSVIVFIPEEDHHITVGMWDVSRKWVLLDEYRVPQSEVTYWMPIVREPLDTSYTKCKYVERSTTEQIRDLQKKNFELEAERSELQEELQENILSRESLGIQLDELTKENADLLAKVEEQGKEIEHLRSLLNK